MSVGDLPRPIAAQRCGILAATVSAARFAQALRQALTTAHDLTARLERNTG